MKTFKMIEMAFVAIMFCFSMSSCNKENFIEVDYTQDLAGTWTLLEPGLAAGMEIKADGSVISTSLVNGEYSENVPGKIEVENNKVCLTLEDGTIFKGLLEIIPGETFVIVDEESGMRLTHRYCKEDLSEEVLGMWVCNEVVEDMMILTYQENGKLILTGYSPHGDNVLLNTETTYRVIGDLMIQQIPGKELYMARQLTYIPDGTALGDIMVHRLYSQREGGFVEGTSTFLRVKQTLNLPGQKYDYIKTFISNVKGLDQEIDFMGYTFNFSKMDGRVMDKFLNAILFAIEFPDANTIKYSGFYDGATISIECPITVEGNKMTVKMSERYAAYRDVEFYTFQAKNDTQMHIYMPTYAFETFFANMQVAIMVDQGLLDINDTAAVDAVFNQLAQAVETINLSLVMSKKK